MSDPALLINADGTITTWFTTMGIWQDAQGFSAEGPYFGRSTGRVGGPLGYSPAAPVVPVGLPGSWDRYLETAAVRRNPDATLTMWYMGRPALEMSNTALGQMVSTDPEGIHWVRRASPIYTPTPGAWDSLFICGPSVVKAPNGLWYLFYTGATPGVEGIGLLLSKDGVNWTPYGNGPVFGPQPGSWDSEIVEQTVIYFKGQFWMWYSGYRGPLNMADTPISIGLATSRDGLTWTRHPGNPVITPGPQGSWNDFRVLAPDVVVQPDGSLLMAAYGQSRTDAIAGSIGLWKSVP